MRIHTRAIYRREEVPVTVEKSGDCLKCYDSDDIQLGSSVHSSGSSVEMSLQSMEGGITVEGI